MNIPQPISPNYQSQFANLGSQFQGAMTAIGQAPIINQQYRQLQDQAEQIAQLAKNLKDTKETVSAEVAGLMAGRYDAPKIKTALNEIQEAKTSEEVIAKYARFLQSRAFYEKNKDHLDMVPLFGEKDYVATHKDKVENATNLKAFEAGKNAKTQGEFIDAAAPATGGAPIGGVAKQKLDTIPRELTEYQKRKLAVDEMKKRYGEAKDIESKLEQARDNADKLTGQITGAKTKRDMAQEDLNEAKAKYTALINPKTEALFPPTIEEIDQAKTEFELATQKVNEWDDLTDEIKEKKKYYEKAVEELSKLLGKETVSRAIQSQKEKADQVKKSEKDNPFLRAPIQNINTGGIPTVPQQRPPLSQFRR